MRYTFIVFFILFCNCIAQGKTNGQIKNESSITTVISKKTNAANNPYKLVWNWEGKFSKSEKEKCVLWITGIYIATMNTLGTYPFDVHIYLIKSDSKRPVPFGFARRKNKTNQIHLYVNPTADLDVLLRDWTAPHEFSHLAIPFVAKKNKWFSEGFATFLSRQTLMDMGYLTQQEFDEMYTEKIIETKKYYNSTTQTFREVSDSLFSNHTYSAVYWGASSFLFTLDKKMRNERGYRFVEIIKKYQKVYRKSDKYLIDIIKSFDKIIGKNWCVNLMKTYRNKPAIEILKNY